MGWSLCGVSMVTAIKCNLRVGIEFVVGEWGMVGGRVYVVVTCLVRHGDVFGCVREA